MVKITIKFAAIVVGSLMFACWMWRAIPFAEPQPLRTPTVEEWSKPFGPNYTPPANDHLPREFYTQPFTPGLPERQ